MAIDILFSFWARSFCVKIVFPFLLSISQIKGDFLTIGMRTKWVHLTYNSLMAHQRVLNLWCGPNQKNPRNLKCIIFHAANSVRVVLWPSFTFPSIYRRRDARSVNNICGQNHLQLFISPEAGHKDFYLFIYVHTNQLLRHFRHGVVFFNYLMALRRAYTDFVKFIYVHTNQLLRHIRHGRHPLMGNFNKSKITVLELYFWIICLWIRDADQLDKNLKSFVLLSDAEGHSVRQ